MQKAFCTVSHGATCILTGLTPILIKLQETAELYYTKKKKTFRNQRIDTALGYKEWRHPADTVQINPVIPCKAQTLTVYTDRSKTESGVGAGVIIFKDQQAIHQMKPRLDKNCTNNQAEQIAILKALDKLKESNLDNQEKTAALYTDSLITLDSLKKMNNHNAITEGIRSSLRTLEAEGWNIQFSWIKHTWEY